MKRFFSVDSAIFLLILCMIISFWGHTPFCSVSAASDCINHGDVNLNGQITAEDAQLAFFIVLGLFTPSYEEECAADCNGSGDVTAADAQAIFLVVLGLGDCADPLIPPTAVPTQTPTPVPPGHLYATDAIAGNMRFVPAGTFSQGSPNSEPCRAEHEGPVFTHTLTRNIAVMEIEISRQMWADLKALQPTLPADPTDLTINPSMIAPVQHVQWIETLLFANLLSVENGFVPCYYKDSSFTIPVDVTNYLTQPYFCDFDADGYRLPTEGEWEYFARAGTSGPFHDYEPYYSESTCGTSNPDPPLTVLDSIAWWSGNSGFSTHPGGTKQPNLWNIYDIHGNVAELCWDKYSETYPAGPVTDYRGSGIGQKQVMRTNGWIGHARLCRSAHRVSVFIDEPLSYLGFRLVRTVP